MSSVEIYVVIAGVGMQLVTAALGYFQSVQNSKKADILNRKADELHLSLNSRLTELLAITKAAAHAEGMREGMSGKPNPQAPPSPLP